MPCSSAHPLLPVLGAITQHEPGVPNRDRQMPAVPGEGLKPGQGLAKPPTEQLSKALAGEAHSCCRLTGSELQSLLECSCDHCPGLLHSGPCFLLSSRRAARERLRDRRQGQCAHDQAHHRPLRHLVWSPGARRLRGSPGLLEKGGPHRFQGSTQPSSPDARIPGTSEASSGHAQIQKQTTLFSGLVICSNSYYHHAS